MLASVVGMPRSGSTFAFNVARQLLIKRGSLHQEVSADLVDALLRAPSFDNILLKSHEASETSLLLAKHGAARLICTVRPIADAVASWIETFAFDEASTVHQFSRWLELFEKLKPVSLVLPFAMIDSTPIEACSHIARHLGVGVSEDELGAIAGELDKTENKMKFDALSADDPRLVDVGFSYYDPETFFHRRHISSIKSREPAERVDPKQLSRIEDKLSQLAARVGFDPFLTSHPNICVK